MGTHPVIDGACPTVVVHATSASAEESVLARPDVTVPDVWVPDSSVWVQRLRAQTAGADSPVQSIWLYPPIARSPLVLATPSAQQQALTAVAGRGWPAVLADTSVVSMVDPSNTDGLLALLTTQSLLNGSASTPSRRLVNSLVTMSKTVLPGPDAGFLALSQHSAGARAFPASEQDVVAANVGAAAVQNPQVTAVYPSGAGLELDYPVVQFAPPGGDPAQRDAAVAFIGQLSQGYAQQRMREAGLRDATGAPLTGAAPEQGVAATSVQPLNVPAPDRVSDALRAWTAAGRPNRTLVVIDLSGSMAETAGGGQTKIAVAAQAEKAALDFFPDTSALGLWGFSVNRTPATDWAELVSLGPLGAKLGAATRRQALAQAAARLPSQTSGNTGLYNTTLAAFEAVRAGYDPSAINSVVLLSDGANTDTSGVDLVSLLSRLRSESTTSRPLPIITLAVGADADAATLKKISAATRGTEYTVDQPGDIRAAFLDAIIKTG